MCGRYTLITPEKVLAERFAVDAMPTWSPRYNLAPTQEGLIIRHSPEGNGRTGARLRWGLVPHWSHPGTQMAPLINARSETAAEKPAFRHPFRHRRCLVPTDGFIEWSRRSGQKMPYLFTLADSRPFAMAGLWDRWEGEPGNEPIETFTILTTAANAVMEPYHDRMPVILDAESSEAWLDPYLVAPEPLTRMLQPLPSSELRVHPVNPRINSTKHDDPSCLEPPPQSPPAPPAVAQLDLGF